MENKMTPLATSKTKRAWHIMRVVFFMIRKGIFKRKLMMDLNMMLKRGKITGKAAIHHPHNLSAPSISGAPGAHEYEFSCSNTPAHNFPWKPRKSSHLHNLLFGCTHLPHTPDHHPTHLTFDCQAVVEMLDKSNYLDGPPAMMPSPMLPGFGRTPMARQLRITDSPFPLNNDDEDDYVDKAAEDFIANFYKQLRRQQ